MTEHPIERVARLLDEWAISDSMLVLDRTKIARLFREDFARTHADLPTDSECFTFICGDDDGKIPSRLTQGFPRVHAYLNEVWE